MKWLEDIERHVTTKDVSPYTFDTVRKLIAAIKLVEHALAYQRAMPGTRAKELRDTVLARLHSGEVEEPS